MLSFINNKKIIITILVIINLIAVITGILSFYNRTKDIDKKVTKNYTAYVKINPVIKLEFKETCINNICNEPVVTKYESINEDAKDIYINLKIEETNTLGEILELICKTAKDNNIVFESVDIYSDWKNVDNYIEENKSEDITWVYNINIKEKKELKDIEETLENEKIIYTVTFNTNSQSEIKEQKIEKNQTIKQPQNPTKEGYNFIEWQLDGKKFDFTTKITKDITLVAKWEKLKVEDNKNDNQNPTNNQSGTNNNHPSQSNNNNNNSANITKDEHKGIINLNDNVLYSEAETVYSCDNCIPDNVLSLLKTAKGYYDYNAGAGSNKSYVWYKSIVLSDKYDTAEYKEQKYNFSGMLEDAGATFVGGSYDEPTELLTETICNRYKLSCDRW